MTVARPKLSALPNWPALMRAPTAAAYLDMSHGSFMERVKSGDLPAPYRQSGFSRSVFWRRDDIDQWLNERQG